MGSLIVGRQSPGLKAALWELVEAAQRDDPMAPVTVVAPSSYAGLSLRQELGQRGFVNVRFIQLPALAELLGGAALAAEGRRPLTATLESINLRQALSQVGGALAPVSGHGKTQASVRASFRELRRLEAAELEELAGREGVTAEVAALYRKYREDIGRDWFDAEDLAAKAAEVVAQGRAAALTDLGHIIFYLPRRPSPAEARLMQALAEQGRCSLVLGATGDAQADDTVLALAGDLEPALGAPRRVGDDQDAPILPGEARLHVAPNTHEELRRVIREMVAEAGKDTPFHRMAVLYRMENPYAALIGDELALAGIPMSGPSREVLAESAVGRTLLGLLGLADKDFRRDEVMAWLTGCPVRPPGGAGTAATFSPSRWDSVSRQAGVVGGLEQWSGRLEAYAKSAREQAEEGEKTEAISEARAAAMRESADTAGELREFVVGLAEAVEPPNPGSSWTAFCQWAERLLDDYLWRPGWDAGGGSSDAVRERLERDRENVLQILEELKAADAINTAASAEEFRQVLTDALQRAQGRLGPTGQGVFVSPFATAAGMSFDAIWLVGMIEGGTPPALRPDPLLPAAARGGAGKPSLAEQRRERHIRGERLDYLSALATAPRRTLSYPVADAAARREAHPSRWLLEQATALAGEQVHSSNLASFSGRPWLSVTQSAAQALRELEDINLADGLDYNLHRLLGWSAEAQQRRRHPLVLQSTLARADTMARRRNSRRLTEFDGNLSQVAAVARFGRSLTGTPISPTRLEAWAGCPFRYFLGNVLRLGVPETPEDTAAISPLERGSLMHTILERFIIQTNEAGRLPQPGREWSEADRRRLMGLAEEAFAAAEGRGVTGKPLLWELAKRDIRDDLDAFLVEEAKLRGRNNTGILQVEAQFGMGGESPEVLDGETGLRFRGYIDRVDISADGKSALVVDYKTGSISPYRGLADDPIDRGKRLQLGIYSLAAKELAPRAAQFRAAYWFPTGRGEFRFAPEDYFDIDDEETAARFREGVSLIVRGIGEGAFPANPGEFRNGNYENCRFCDFDGLCPSRRDDLWERKKGDSLAATYRELAEGLASGEADWEVE